MRISVLPLFYLLFISISLVTFSQQQALGEPVTLQCAYKISCGLGGLEPANDFNLMFIVDVEKETAYVIGNQGSNEVHYIPNTGGFTFVEVTGAGNVMTTTIDSNKNTVHSRNTILNDVLVPMQYYGLCEVK